MKIPKIFKPSRSIAGRLTLRVILTILLVFIIISGVIAGVAWFAGIGMGVLHYDGAQSTSTEKIGNVFTAVETAISNNEPEVEKNLKNPESMYAIVERILQINPNIVGSAIAFEPDYYPEKGTWYAPYAFRKDSVTIETKQLGNKDYEYHYMDWYQIPKLLSKPYWSEPYFDEGGGDQPMATYSLPLYDSHGDMYAVLTADISLDWLADLTHRLDSINNQDQGNTLTRGNGHSFSFIIGRGGTYIVHPDKERILNETIFSYCMETETEEDDSVAYKMIEGKKGYSSYWENGKMSFIFYAPVEHIGWSIATVVPHDDIFEDANVISIVFLILMGVGLVIVFFVCYLTIKRITQPLTRFAHSADEIAKGNFMEELPAIHSNDEMLRLRKSFETMQKSLIQQIEETKTINEEKGRIDSELHIAHDIQIAMLPKVFPPFPDRTDIDVYAQQNPAKEVGGDLYDFYIRDEKLFFCIGDVSGKGVPASLVMSVTMALFRNVSAHEAMPDRIVSNINDTLTQNNDSDMFVTLFIGVLDLPTGRLRYTNAGHDAPLLLDAENVRIGYLPVDSNLPVGVIPNWKYTSQEAIIDPQTVIFLYTDGLTEAEDSEHRQFGEERIFNTAKSTTPHQLIDIMTTAVHDFVVNAEQSDDLTMMAIRYTKKQLDVRMQRSITLTNNIDEVPKLAEFVDIVCEAVGFDMSTTMSLNLAMEEAVVNVMNYAYPAGTTGIVNITAEANDERLKFVISDSGKPFDPTTKSEVDTTLSAEDRPIGGLGIHLVRQIMDSINYERTDGKNVLTLRKKLV